MPRNRTITPKNETEALIQAVEAMDNIEAELKALNHNIERTTERIILALHGGGEPRPPRPGTQH
jgi:hypothetical protein